jgi:hypothetical protein
MMIAFAIVIAAIAAIAAASYTNIATIVVAANTIAAIVVAATTTTITAIVVAATTTTIAAIGVAATTTTTTIGVAIGIIFGLTIWHFDSRMKAADKAFKSTPHYKSAELMDLLKEYLDSVMRKGKPISNPLLYNGVLVNIDAQKVRLKSKEAFSAKKYIAIGALVFYVTVVVVVVAIFVRPVNAPNAQAAVEAQAAAAAEANKPDNASANDPLVTSDKVSAPVYRNASVVLPKDDVEANKPDPANDPLVTSDHVSAPVYRNASVVLPKDDVEDYFHSSCDAEVIPEAFIACLEKAKLAVYGNFSNATCPVSNT